MGSEDVEESRRQDTVFVRNLCDSVDDDALNEAFSEIGPVKSAFVIVHKEGPRKGQSRGFGFVQFALPEDAELAVKKLHGELLQGALLKLALAQKRGFRHSSDVSVPVGKKKMQDEENDKVYFFRSLAKEALAQGGVSIEKDTGDEEENRVNITAELLRDCSVIVFDPPKGMTEAKLRKKAGKAGKVNLIEFPLTSLDLHDDSRSLALIVYTKKSSAAKALKKLDKRTWKSEAFESLVHCRRLKQISWDVRGRDARCKVIVRNLDMKLNEKEVETAFAEYGPVLNIFSRDNQGKRLKGFAFVQFACRLDAQKAITGLNGQKLGDRVVAIDWALTKQEYQQKTTETRQKEREAGMDKDDEEVEEEDDDDDDYDDNFEEEEEKDEVEGKDAFSEIEREQPFAHENDGIGWTIFVRNILFETTEDELYDEFKTFGGVRYVRIVRGPDGRSRGTGFVNFYRESAYESVLDAAGEVPQVEAKIKKRKHISEQQIEDKVQRGGSGIVVGGRSLLVSPALARNEAEQLVSEFQEKRRQDRRHLYLAREGVIKEGSDVDIPKGDLIKRNRSEKEKRTKLKSPLFFVNPVRLSVRNLFRGSADGSEEEPTEKGIAKIFADAARKGLETGFVDDEEGDMNLMPSGWPDQSNLGPVKVKTVKILREDIGLTKSDFVEVERELSMSVAEKPSEDSSSSKNEKSKKKLQGRSKGFAFVEFTEHVHALAALRMLNNNPAFAFLASGGSKSMDVLKSKRSRLMVEFAVENSAKLRKRQQRYEILLKKQRMERNSAKAQKFAERQMKNEEAPKAAHSVKKGGVKRKVTNAGKRKRKEERRGSSKVHQPEKEEKPKRKRSKLKQVAEKKEMNATPAKTNTNNAEFSRLVAQFKSEMMHAVKEAKPKKWFD